MCSRLHLSTLTTLSSRARSQILLLCLLVSPSSRGEGGGGGGGVLQFQQRTVLAGGGGCYSFSGTLVLRLTGRSATYAGTDSPTLGSCYRGAVLINHGASSDLDGYVIRRGILIGQSKYREKLLSTDL